MRVLRFASFAHLTMFYLLDKVGACLTSRYPSMYTQTTRLVIVLVMPPSATISAILGWRSAASAVIRNTPSPEDGFSTN